MFKKRSVLKVILSMMCVALVAGVIAGCGTADKQTSTAGKPEVTIKVGAAAVPHAEILNFIKPKLKQDGINMEIVVMDDEDQLNPALQAKQLDANYFQHVPYLNSIAKEKGYDFVVLATVHIEPIGFYSQKIKSIDELREGATIAISNVSSNEYRNLLMLQNKGLIKLKEGINQYSATPKDIVENPKNLKFVEVDPAQLPRSLPDVDGAVIATNRILEAKMDPNTALFREDSKSPYGNIVVVRKGEESRPELKKLAEYLLSPDVKKFIQDKYGIAVVPAF